MVSVVWDTRMLLVLVSGVKWSLMLLMVVWWPNSQWTVTDEYKLSVVYSQWSLTRESGTAIWDCGCSVIRIVFCDKNT
ncbi:hypothetical protein BpHYR1_010631 [Brachionus plicatilis]|uniref:Uncharacterized protein n=1 Tax=Brachionus plicatilis TaxID=10195 RepID=A0A3M7S6R7_BRAPC|nr:hypothetical protein BpHYR1_010631 [Brachionus plicatilis]